MREKYESLSVAALRDIAKARGIKGISTMKKAEIVEAMLAEDAKGAAAKKPEPGHEHVNRTAPRGEAPEKEEPKREGTQRPKTRAY